MSFYCPKLDRDLGSPEAIPTCAKCNHMKWFTGKDSRKYMEKCVYPNRDAKLLAFERNHR